MKRGVVGPVPIAARASSNRSRPNCVSRSGEWISQRSMESPPATTRWVSTQSRPICRNTTRHRCWRQGHPRNFWNSVRKRRPHRYLPRRSVGLSRSGADSIFISILVSLVVVTGPLIVTRRPIHQWRMVVRRIITIPTGSGKAGFPAARCSVPAEVATSAPTNACPIAPRVKGTLRRPSGRP